MLIKYTGVLDLIKYGINNLKNMKKHSKRMVKFLVLNRRGFLNTINLNLARVYFKSEILKNVSYPKINRHLIKYLNHEYRRKNKKARKRK
jgi:hypothetical protein